MFNVVFTQTTNRWDRPLISEVCKTFEDIIDAEQYIRDSIEKYGKPTDGSYSIEEDDE